MSSALASSISDNIENFDLRMQDQRVSDRESSDDDSRDLLEEYPGIQGLVDQRQPVPLRHILEALRIGYLGKEVTIHWGNLLTRLFSKDYIFGKQKVRFRNIDMEVRLYPYNRIVEIAHIILDEYHKLSARDHSNAASNLEIICNDAHYALRSAHDIVTEANEAAHTAFESGNIHEFNIQAHIAYEATNNLDNTVDDARIAYDYIVDAVSVTKKVARNYIRWTIGRAHDNIEWSAISNNAVAVVTANLVLDRTSEYIDSINANLSDITRINSELNAIATSYILREE